MMRLFIGINLPQAAKEALWNEVSAIALDGQMTELENYHITLAYLGERDEIQLTQIETLIAKAVRKCVPFPLTIRGTGSFGKQEHAILYAALAPSKPLFFLNAELRQLLKKSGESFDVKPMIPHVTLARKMNLVQTNREQSMQAIPFSANSLTLFHSTRVEGKLRYIPIYEAKITSDL